MTYQDPAQIGLDRKARSQVTAKSAQNFWVKTLFKMLQHLEHGHLEIQLPDGSAHHFGAQPSSQLSAVIHIHELKTIRRFLLSGDIGIAEAYRNEEWSTPDLTALFRVILANQDFYAKTGDGIWLMKLVNFFRHRLRGNNKSGSKKNISFHYDLGNRFYQQWLDPSMTYSSALFNRDDQTLEQAQTAKYDRILELAEMQKNQSVLEIGCGWGGFAERAVEKFNCDLTGLTLSKEQLDFANQRLENQQMHDKAKAVFCDYRDSQGTYDRIVSIEMFEAVGEEHWHSYFQTLRDRLKQDGVAVVQSITIDEKLFENYRNSADFIQHFIFPGGMLPTKSHFAVMAAKYGLRLEHQEFFGKSYARTLNLWQQHFLQAWTHIKPLGFDQKFKQLWKYYLSYCEAGFDHGRIDVGLFKLRKI